MHPPANSVPGFTQAGSRATPRRRELGAAAAIPFITAGGFLSAAFVWFVAPCVAPLSFSVLDPLFELPVAPAMADLLQHLHAAVAARAPMSFEGLVYRFFVLYTAVVLAALAWVIGRAVFRAIRRCTGVASDQAADDGGTGGVGAAQPEKPGNDRPDLQASARPAHKAARL
jgi:hypothetical protein